MLKQTLAECFLREIRLLSSAPDDDCMMSVPIVHSLGLQGGHANRSEVLTNRNEIKLIEFTLKLFSSVKEAKFELISLSVLSVQVNPGSGVAEDPG